MQKHTSAAEQKGDPFFTLPKSDGPVTKRHNFVAGEAGVRYLFEHQSLPLSPCRCKAVSSCICHGWLSVFPNLKKKKRNREKKKQFDRAREKEEG